jgi:hypothetical protein
VDDSSTTMEVNGSRVENVLETALTAGQCVIQGYQRGANS